MLGKSTWYFPIVHKLLLPKPDYPVRPPLGVDALGADMDSPCLSNMIRQLPKAHHDFGTRKNFHAFSRDVGWLVDDLTERVSDQRG